jgi:PilZ domain-containing protein
MTSDPQEDASARAERRIFNRRKFQGILEIEWGSATLKASVRDLGPQGLFVELVPPLWVGAMFSARLVLDPPLQMICTVCRVEPVTGFAVAFKLPEESGKAQLEELLAALPKV